MPEVKRASVVLVSPNTLAREGLRRILDEGQFHVIDAVACISLLPEAAESDDGTNLIVLDEFDQKAIPVEVERVRQCFEKSSIVVLVESFDLESMTEAFRNGADGYIVKMIDCKSLIGSLQLVAMGQKVMPSELAEHLPTRTDTDSVKALDGLGFGELLSEREIETLRHLLKGHSNKIIAMRLDITEATVKVHVKSILRKLRVENRTQAAIWAMHNGLPRMAPNPAIVPNTAHQIQRANSAFA